MRKINRDIFIICTFCRCTKLGETKLAASWSELGRVNIWNLQEQLNAIENPSLLTAYRNKCDKTDGGIRPLYTFKGHLSEGFGLDWCCTEPGTLASGDCKGNIHIWRIDSTSASWHVDQRPYNSHAPHSVEDLQWSPNEKNVLASCSVDKRFVYILSINYISDIFSISYKLYHKD